jgi:acyl-CoA thioesterase-1
MVVITRMPRRLAVLLSTLALVLALPAQGAAAPVVLVVGDSLSAGYNMRAEQGWVALLAARVAAAGLPQQVVNASISGDTTQSGVARLPRALERHRPAIVVLELGANDGLRGIPVETTRANLTRMVALARAAGAQVLLIGVQLPTNYGNEWNSKFHAIYTELARAERLPLLPTFVSAAIATDPELMQADGLHPNPRAQPLLLDSVWPLLLPMLQNPAPPRPAPRSAARG